MRLCPLAMVMCSLLAPASGWASPRERLIELRAAVSIAAETATIIDLRRRGAVTDTYARQMRKAAREELTQLAASTRQDAPDVARLVEGGLLAIDRDDAAALRTTQAQLRALEGGLAQTH